MNRVDHQVLLAASKEVRREPPANLVPKDDELFADAYSYRTLNCYLKYLGNSRVTSSSVVYKNGRVVPETVVEPEQRGYYQYRYLPKQLFTAKKIGLSGSVRHLLATDAWSTGHFHWFMEVLPKLVLLGDRTREFVLLLPDSGYVRSVGAETISRLSLEFADIVFMKPSEFYSVPDLSFISPVAAPGQVDDQLMQQINHGLVGTGPVGSSRLYVSRAKAAFRKVLNESELTAGLTAHGFETVYPEDHTLAEQIEMFSSCGTLVGLHGAGLTNNIFMRPAANVLELRKRERNYGYWHLAESVGHRYFYYNGTPDSDQTLIGRGCNLSINTSELEAVLREIEL